MTSDEPRNQRVRVRFAKHESLKYISHLDLARTWERAFRRGGMPVAYSQGFNPRPRFQIAAALPVGVIGHSELLDVWLTDAVLPQEIHSRLEAVLPSGLQVQEVQEVEYGAPSLQSQMRAAEYRAVIRSQEAVEAIRTRIVAMLAQPSLPRQRHHKGKWQTYDLRPLIQTMDVKAGDRGECVLTLRLQANPQGAGRPDEVLDVLGLTVAIHTMERTNLHFEFDK